MVLNVYPADIAGRYGAGNWKDIRAFGHLLLRSGKEVVDLGVTGESFGPVFDLCAGGATDLIVQYSFWPELLKEVRRQFPHVRICVRTHNAEALQHWQREGVCLSLACGNLRAVYGSLRLLCRDARCRQLADALLGISEWDNRNYWHRLPGRAEIRDVPYHSPWPDLRPQVRPRPWEERRNAMVCLAGGRDRIGRSQVEGFSRLAEALRGSIGFAGWSFEVSPGVFRSDQAALQGGSVELMPELKEPWDLLCSVKVLALLTPLGFGSKTTIVDALAAGCHVLVDPVLAGRLPANVRSLCHCIDLEKSGELPSRLALLGSPPVEHNLNRELFCEAFRSVSESLRHT